MQLNVARVCLDCEEVHDAQECPVCASEVFAYLTRWVPSQVRVSAPAHQRTAAPAPAPSRLRMLVPGMLGVGALGLAGWIWRGRAQAARNERGSDSGSSVAPFDTRKERNR
jgi:hypothetical protein